MNIISFLATAENSVTTLGLMDFGTQWFPLAGIIRGILFQIDGLIYRIIPEIYTFALRLADIRTVLDSSGKLITDISTGIYNFLAIAMFFRFVFAILTMIADPDKIADKQKGLGKIVMNSIITIVLIVAVPSIFGIAYDAQAILIGVPGEKQGAIYNAITRIGSSSKEFEAVDTGTELSKRIFNLFVGFDTSYDGGNKDQIALAYEKYLDSGVFKVSDMSEFIDDKNKNRFAISYLILLSTAVGLFTLWMLITITIEVAVRSLKLFVLQVISPIAIMTYIDPDSATKGIFKKWVDVCLKTYLSLFFRIAVMAFFITIMSNIDFSALTTQSGWLVLFLLIGLLSFIKVAPKMFEEIFNYKPNEDAKFGKQLVGAAVGGALGLGAAGVAGSFSALKNGASFKESITQGSRSAWGGLKSGGKAGYSGSGGKLALSGLTGAKGGIKDMKGSKTFKTYSDAHEKLVEDGKSKDAWQSYKSTVAANTDEAAALAELTAESTRYAPGMPEANTAKHAAAQANLQAFNTDAALKKDYIDNRAKKVANTATYSRGSNVGKALEDNYDKEWAAKIARKDYMKAKNVVSMKQSKYAADPSDVNATALETAQAEADRLELLYDDAQKAAAKAEKVRDAMLEAPANAKDAEKYKRISRGKNISG